jgi:transcriptional regulator with XRE-family HTH domain
MNISRESLINVKELGGYIRQKRQSENLSLRAVAKLTEVSASTLSRIETGKDLVPDAPTLARLSQWLQIPMERIVGGVEEAKNGVPPVVYYPSESMPAIVEAHLRADRNLTPETAHALAQLFRVAYEGYCNAGRAKR